MISLEKVNHIIKNSTEELFSDVWVSNPLVSVLMVTYNHKKFINQAIESVLEQKSNFSYEIVIGDDNSNDKTTDIVLDYQSKYPETIKVLLANQNLGHYTGNVSLNFVRTYRACRGKYIAILEGDDYWTSQYKLQKQVDFLEKNNECSTCFHNVRVIYESQYRAPEIFINNLTKDSFDLSDILKFNFIPTCSVMFRNGLFEEIPGWCYKTPMFDWPLHILNAHYGEMAYIKDIMAVYRIRQEGIWGHKNRIDLLIESDKAAEIIRDNVDNKYKDLINKIIALRCWEISIGLSRRNDFGGALYYAIKCLINAPINFELSKVFLYKEILRGYLPRLYKLLKLCKLKFTSLI